MNGEQPIVVRAKQMKANGIYATMYRCIDWNIDIRSVLDNVLTLMSCRKDRGLPFQGGGFTLEYHYTRCYTTYEIDWNTRYDPSDNTTYNDFHLHIGNGELSLGSYLVFQSIS